MGTLHAARALQYIVLLYLWASQITFSEATTIKADPKDRKYSPRLSDVNLIKCDVCRYLAQAALDGGERLLSLASEKNIGEAEFIEFVERMTTSWRDEGEWITKLHLDVKSSWGKESITVVDMKRPGECGEACKTIEKASKSLMGEHDADVGEALYVGRHRRNVKEFTRWLCWELLDACGNQALPARNLALKSYPPFKPLATGHEKQSMDRVLGEMEDAGLRGKVWSREELEQFVGRQASSSSNEL